MASCKWQWLKKHKFRFDANGKYFTITQQIERKVKLFSGYDGFREANLFQVDANSYILEVSYVKDGKLFRDRKPLTQSEFEELQVKFAASALFQEKTRQPKQDGRRHFLLLQQVGAPVFTVGLFLRVII